jgi:hypothetical protein
MLILVAALLLSPNSPSYDPTVNISAVREIECDNHYGSGFLIAKNTIATALHVASGSNCRDVATGKRLVTYKRDEVHDFALVTGELPTEFPYIKYSCARFNPNQVYLAYGISASGYGYYHPQRIIRQYTLTATNEITDKDFTYDKTPHPGMRRLTGRAAPGTSGGPIVDLDGYAHGLVNAGHNLFGIPMGPSYSFEFADTILCK